MTEKTEETEMKDGFFSMRWLLAKVKRYPLSCLLTAAIWVACLMPVPETPLSDVSFFDKWVHMAMYFVLVSLIWWEYMRCHRPSANGQKTTSLRKLLLGGWLAPLLMGGLIELAQAYLTAGNRSGEWLDFLANGTGATVGVLTCMLLAKCLARV